MTTIKKNLVILSAGIGSRLKNITKDKPKCLLNLVNNKTLLENQLNIFKDYNIYLILGYLYEKVLPIVKNYKNVKVIINKDYLTTNNMYSLNLVRNYLYNQSFFVLNGDIYLEYQILKDIDNIDDKNLNMIFVDKGKYNEENMKVSINNDGNIIKIDKKLKKNNSLGLSTDFYHINDSKILFDEIEKYLKNDKNSWSEKILQKMMDNMIIFKPVYVNSFWYEVDNYNDYISYINKIFFIKKGNYNYNKYFIDIDGTILLENILVKGADKLLNNLKDYTIITNNSSKSKNNYIDIMNNQGIKNINNFISSINSTINYLKNEKYNNIYVFGTKNVKNEFKNFNILESKDKNIEIIIITYHNNYNYKELIEMIYLINNNNIPYIATHKDVFCPTPNGYIPDIGITLDIIYRCTNKKPLKILGKPNLVLNIKNNDKCLLIGDNIETDYKQARNLNIDFCLTLTGRTNIEYLEKNIHNLDKIFVVNSISELNKIIL